MMTYQELLSLSKDYLKPVIKGEDAFLVAQVRASVSTAKWLVGITFLSAIFAAWIALLLIAERLFKPHFSMLLFLAQASGAVFSFVPFLLARLYQLHLHSTFLKREYDIQVMEEALVNPDTVPKVEKTGFDFCHHCGLEVRDAPEICPHCGKSLFS